MSINLDAQPRELGGALRRWWRARHPSVRTLLAWLMAIAAVFITPFLFCVNRVGSAQATEVALTLTSPFQVQAGIPGVILAIVGYLAVPAIVGAIVSASIDLRLSRLQRELAQHSSLLNDSVSAARLRNSLPANSEGNQC